MAKVIFNVGVKHPLFNKVIEAEIINSNSGYNGNCIVAKTKEKVHFPYNPKGIVVFNDNGDIIDFKPTQAHDDYWEGWVKTIVEDNAITVDIFDAKTKEKILTCDESTPYSEGEIFIPFEKDYYVCVFASKVENGKQIVVALKQA